MDDDRSMSPASVASSFEEVNSKSFSCYQPIINPFWCFNSTPIIRHNFKSIDALLSPSPTFSYKNDDTGYNSQLLSSSSLSLHNHGSIDEDMKPTNETKNIKTKKIRTAFTDDQKLNLDRFYSTNRYPDPTQMDALSRVLLLDEKVIRVWFQNKRSREKTHSNQRIWQ